MTISISLDISIVVAAITSILFIRSWLNYRALPKLSPVDSIAVPDCMVVIPARNEDKCIARAVKSLPADTVIVVDDLSADGTAEEAQQAGAGVLTAPELPKGAAGKAHACMIGARVLTSRWVLFADADTWHEKGFLNAVVAHAEASGLDLLSVQLTPAPQSFVEHLLVPYLSGLFFTGAKLSRDFAAVFSGRCVLVRREPYEFLGGHAAVLEHPTEDVKLAALALRHRLKVSVARAGKLGHVRLYTGWRGTWDGIDREALRLALLNPGTGAVILLSAVVATLWLPLVAWLWIDQQRVAAACFFVLMLLLLRPWYGTLRVLLAPFGIYAAIPFLLHALGRTLSDRPLKWKGRVL